MKQKEETKVTTLCRLVAVYNAEIRAMDLYNGIISVTIADPIVCLTVNKRVLYNGSLDDAIAYMAIRLCELSSLPRVAVDVMF